MTFVLSEDSALKDLLKGMIVSDDNNPERPVEVFFSIPDVEVRQQKYPYVTIELLDIRPANDRQHSGWWTDYTLNGTIPTDEETLYTYYTPVAWDLVYQINSWARHPYHDRAILVQMLRDRFPSKYGKLPVPNDIGTGTYNRSMFLDEFVKFTSVEDGRRLYRNILTVRVVSEMTPAEATYVSTKLAERVLINDTTTFIPTGYDIV